MAQVLSNEPTEATLPNAALNEATKITRLSETVRKILIFSGKTPPLLFLNLTKADWDAVHAKVEQMDFSTRGSEAKEKYLANLRWIPAEDVTPGRWSQDRFQVFNDPRDGSPVLRPIDAHTIPGVHATQDLIAAMAKECSQIKLGPPLKSYSSNSDEVVETPREYGGNIEFASQSGMCLRGATQPVGFVRQFCRAEDDIALPSDWLKVGHIDEYLNTMPVPGTQCDVAISIASYRKAKTLFEKNPKEPLFEADYPASLNASLSVDAFKAARHEAILLRGPFAQFCKQRKPKSGHFARPKSPLFLKKAEVEAGCRTAAMTPAESKAFVDRLVPGR